MAIGLYNFPAIAALVLSILEKALSHNEVS
jgi:hypothetical protein